MLESLKCALKNKNSTTHLHFLFIPESTVPAKIVTTTLAKSSEKAGTDNCGKPCLLTKSHALEINIDITGYPATLASSLTKIKGFYFPLLLQ